MTKELFKVLIFLSLQFHEILSKPSIKSKNKYQIFWPDCASEMVNGTMVDSRHQTSDPSFSFTEQNTKF